MRRFHAVDWAVLESASTAFQAAAIPFSYQSIKKARCRCDTGLWVFSRNRYGLMSHAHWIGRERIRRLIGECTRPFSQFVTQPYRSHGSFSQWAARQELSTCIYRLDAAGSEMVHGKFRETAALSIRRRKWRFYSRLGRKFSIARDATARRWPSQGSQPCFGLLPSEPNWLGPSAAASLR